MIKPDDPGKRRGPGVIPWCRPVPVLPRHGFTLCDQRAAVVETFDRERVSAGTAELAAFEETFARFEGAAVFGDEVRELLLRVMADFRNLGDLLTR